jgi:Subtilase family
VSHGLSQRARAGVSPGFHHRARVGVAAGLTLAFIAMASSPALADQARRNEWWLRTLHVTNAWRTTRGSGVTIAVLDTGVNPAQADLTGAVVTGPDYTNSGRTSGGQFWGIHGTEVASLIAGRGHGPGRANGIIGIAPAAKILSVRVTLESNDPLLSNQTIAAGLPNAIAHGIKWAVRHGATVIDLPLDPVTAPGAVGSGGSPAERAAVSYAEAKHVVLVAPAGDNGTDSDSVNYPAAYRGVISVGAFNRQFVKAPFSSHQPYVTVTAAGVGVTAAGPSGSYPQLNSTSAASAVVAGIVALIQAQFPTLKPAQVTKALTTSTVFHPPGGRADGSGFGTVDATKALTAAAAIAETVSKPASSSTTAGQAPPSAPASHSSPIHRNIRGTLVKDAAIAGVVFVLLLGLIFAITTWRRRRARSARLAEVRAAAQPARRAGPGAAKKRAAAKAGARGLARKGEQAGDTDSGTAEPQLEPTGFIAAPLGPAAQGPGAAGFTGSASPAFTGSAAGFTGSSGGFTGSSAGFTGSAAGFTGSAAGFTGSAAGFTGSAVGFTGSSAGFAGSSAGFTGSASAGFAAASPPPGPSAGSDPGGLTDPGGGPDSGGLAGPAGRSDPGGFAGPGGGSEPGGLAGPAGRSGPGGLAGPGGRSDLGSFAGLGGGSDPGGLAGPAGRSDPGGFASPGSRSDSGGFAGPGGGSDPGGLAGPAGRSDPGGFASPGSRSDPGGFAGGRSGAGGLTGPASAALGPSAGLGGAPGPASPDAFPAGTVPPDLASPAVTGPGAPPWARIQSDPRTPAGETAGAAIPDSAFPRAPAAPAADMPAGGPELAAGGPGLSRMSSRLTQGPRQPRAPQVTGRPPWEPAPEPDSELPWAQAPAPSRGGTGSLPKPEQVRTELPSWDELAQEAWPGGPKAARPHPPVSPAEPDGPSGRAAAAAPVSRVVPAAGLVPPQPDSPEQTRPVEDRPDYRWNPGAGVEPFRAAQAEPAPAPGSAASLAADAAAAVSQPGVSAARRPSLALPRRLGSAAARQAGGAHGPGRGMAPAGGNLPGTAGAGLTGAGSPAAGPATRFSAGPAGTGPAGAGPAGAGTAGAGPAGAGWTNAGPAGTGPAGAGWTNAGPAGTAAAGAGWANAGPAGAGAAGAGWTSAGATGAAWTGFGAGQPPFPPAPDPGLPAAGQPERGPFPRAIKPPTDPGAPSNPIRVAGTLDAGLSSGGQAAPPFPPASRPANEPGPATAGQPEAGPAFPTAANPQADAPWPKTGVPPWEITDSFMAVPPAEATGPVRASGTGAAASAPAGTPSYRSRRESPAAGGAADSTESLPVVGSSAAEGQSSPRTNPGDSTESFPALRPRADMEDAFRLFPPVRGTDNQPPGGDGQD